MELTNEQEYQVRKMYNDALEAYHKTKDEGWKGYTEGIYDVLIEIGIEVEGITD